MLAFRRLAPGGWRVKPCTWPTSQSLGSDLRSVGPARPSVLGLLGAASIRAGKVELLEGGWPALAPHLPAGRPSPLRAVRSGVPPNPHLLPTGPSRAGARATSV